MYTNNNISVIIPTYRRNGQLKKCIDSVLNQSWEAKEVIIVDNFPNSETKELVNSYSKKGRNIVYIPEKRTGAAFARNTGITYARNSILAFIDDDCVADRKWIEGILSVGKSDKCIYMGISVNGTPDKLISSVEHYLAEVFFKQSTSFIFRNRFSSLLDTKNFSVRKKLITKMNIYFEEKSPPYSFVEDIAYSINLYKKNIPIILNKKSIVKHYGSANLILNIKHQFERGMNFYYVKKNIQKIKKYNIYTQFVAKIDDNIESNIKKITLRNKSIFYKMLFHILIIIDTRLMKLGTLWRQITG